MIIIGVDPGPTAGICVLRYPGQPSWYQCDAASALSLIRWLRWKEDDPDGGNVLLAGEAFQAGRGAGARQGSGAETRNLIACLNDPDWHWRSAGLVKPWATDARIHKAGLWMNGMPHAVDAARHALYCAVHDGGMPDPLSRKPGPWRKGDIVNMATGEIVQP